MDLIIRENDYCKMNKNVIAYYCDLRLTNGLFATNAVPLWHNISIRFVHSIPKKNTYDIHNGVKDASPATIIALRYKILKAHKYLI